MLMARNASMTDGGITPVFRLSGQYDRYGRQLGWLARVAEDGVDVYHLCGRLLGKLVDHHCVLRVLRGTLRTEPVHRARVPGVPHMTPPEPVPSRDPRDGWTDALPWPLAPREPPRH